MGARNYGLCLDVATCVRSPPSSRFRFTFGDSNCVGAFVGQRYCVDTYNATSRTNARSTVSLASPNCPTSLIAPRCASDPTPPSSPPAIRTHAPNTAVTIPAVSIAAQLPASPGLEALNSPPIPSLATSNRSAAACRPSARRAPDRRVGRSAGTPATACSHSSRLAQPQAGALVRAFLVAGGGGGEVGAGAGVFFEGALEVELLGDLSGGGDDLLAEQAQAAH